MSRKLLTLAAALAIAALANAGDSASATYEGAYFYNFENAHFTLKGATKCWAIKGDMSAAELPGKNGKPAWGTADVVVRGVLSAPGRYGNLGACTRSLTVVEVLEVRKKVQQ